MLVHFYVDAHDLMLGGVPDNILNAAHLRLINRWENFGILRFQGKNLEKSDLATSLEGLPQVIRKTWKTALMKQPSMPLTVFLGLNEDNKRTVASKPWENRGVDVACLCDICCHDCVVACAGRGRETVDEDVEIVELSVADLAEKFREAEELSRTPLKAGTPSPGLWQKRFARVAALTRSAVIVDRYILKSVIKAQKSQRRGSLSNLLDFFGSNSNLESLKIFSTFENTASREKHEEAVRNEVLKSSLKKNLYLEIYVLPNSHFGKVSHDRYLRFDEYVFEIGTGCEIFENDKIGRDSTFLFRKKIGHHSDIERKLIDKSEYCASLAIRGTSGEALPVTFVEKGS